MKDESRNQLIEELVGELTPVSFFARALPRWIAWSLMGWVAAAFAISVRGPMRPGAFDALLNQPQFLAQTVIGLLAVLALGQASFRLCAPETQPWGRRAGGAIAIGVLWAFAYGFSLLIPAFEPTMAGKRMGCETETLVLGLILLAPALLLMRGLAPIERVRTGALVGAAAGAIPALMMEFACMYVPWHNFTHHFAPVMLVIAAGAALGPWILRRI